jgi:hypothetical protein
LSCDGNFITVFLLLCFKFEVAEELAKGNGLKSSVQTDLRQTEEIAKKIVQLLWVEFDIPENIAQLCVR